MIDRHDLYSNFLFLQNYRTDITRKQVFDMHCRYGSIFKNVSAPEKLTTSWRLNVGYVSSDFYDHSVSRFMQFIKQHTENINPFCYYNGSKKDGVTKAFVDTVKNWRDVSDKTYSEIYNQIRIDEIDILVDLSGHTSGNLLPVFAMRPAPVQVAYCGYPNTTGLQQIDFRIVDKITDLPTHQKFHTENLIRLDGCFLCYSPVYVGDSTCNNTGAPVFASFSTPQKINDDVIRAWSEILKRISGAKLLLKRGAFGDAAVVDNFKRRFARNGIRGDRLIFEGHEPDQARHLCRYGYVDAILDTFPYNGTTITCESLSCGVPVVSCCGDTHRARVSCSILSEAGMPEFCGDTKQDYIDIACEIGSNVGQYRRAREGIQNQFLYSPVCNGSLFVKKIEAAYMSLFEKRQNNY